MKNRICLFLPVIAAGTLFPQWSDAVKLLVYNGNDAGAGSLRQALQDNNAFVSEVLLSWPAYYGGFPLKSVSNLPASNKWFTVTGTPVVIGDQFNFTNSAPSGNKLYRLRSN